MLQPGDYCGVLVPQNKENREKNPVTRRQNWQEKTTYEN